MISIKNQKVSYLLRNYFSFADGPSYLSPRSFPQLFYVKVLLSSSYSLHFWRNLDWIEQEVLVVECKYHSLDSFEMKKILFTISMNF